MGTTVDSAGAAAGERRGNTTHMLTKPTSDISERQKRSRQVPRKQDTLMRRLLEQDGISGQEMKFLYMNVFEESCAENAKL